MRKLLSLSTVVLLIAGLVFVGSGVKPVNPGPPPHVCENNPNHWSCETTTTVGETTTTGESTTTSTEPSTTTTEPSTTTSTLPPSTSTTTSTLPPTTTTTTTQPTTTTTQPPTTTTTTPSRTLLWTGNRISDWFSVANSGGGNQRDVFVDGAPAVEQYLPEIDGTDNPGARLNHQGFGPDRVLPTEAYYSVEILVPYYIGAQDNVFQFKQGDGGTRRHLWNVGWRPVNGQLQGIIRTRLSGSQWGTLSDPHAFLNWTVPIGEWFTVEVFRRISTGSDGRYEVRIDGVLLYTFDGPTAASNLDPRPFGDQEWVVSHYLGRGFYMDGDVGPTSVFFRNARIERE